MFFFSFLRFSCSAVVSTGKIQHLSKWNQMKYKSSMTRQQWINKKEKGRLGENWHQLWKRHLGNSLSRNLPFSTCRVDPNFCNSKAQNAKKYFFISMKFQNEKYGFDNGETQTTCLNNNTWSWFLIRYRVGSRFLI